MNLYQITFEIDGRPQCWLRYYDNVQLCKTDSVKIIKKEFNKKPANLSIKELAQYENKHNPQILRIGEFQLSKYTPYSILIKKEDGEACEIKIDTLRMIFKEYL